MIEMNFLLALHWKKKVQLVNHLLLEKYYLLQVTNTGISLPVMGCAGIFSTFGVLDSAGNAKVSFLAEKKKSQRTNSLPHFPITQCPNTIHSKHNQVTDYFQKSILLLSLPTRQSTNLL